MVLTKDEQITNDEHREGHRHIAPHDAHGAGDRADADFDARRSMIFDVLSKAELLKRS
jgi:hypothetical protein